MPRSTMTRAQKKRRERMRQAVELREKGAKSREIARHLDCDEKTVRNDLKAWAAESAKVTPLRKRPAENSARRREKSAAEFRADNVVELRKQA